MRGLRLSNGVLKYSSYLPEPCPEDDEVLIRVTRAGICGTDLELTRGYKSGFRGILGHEFVGVVERAPTYKWLGKRVTATINIGCGDCSECHRHGPEHCHKRSVIGILNRGGAFADYLTAPLSNLVAIPDNVSDERAVFAEPLAAALRIREQMTLPAGRMIAVLGPGRLGMLIAKVLSLGGAHVVVLGRRTESLGLARMWGMDVALSQDVPERSFDIAVDATGTVSGFEQALRILRPRGTLVLKSTFSGKTNINASALVVDEIRVQGSRCGPFAPAIELLASGAVNPSALIDGQYPLRDGIAAFEKAQTPGVRKVLLQP